MYTLNISEPRKRILPIPTSAPRVLMPPIRASEPKKRTSPSTGSVSSLNTDSVQPNESRFHNHPSGLNAPPDQMTPIREKCATLSYSSTSRQRARVNDLPDAKRTRDFHFSTQWQCVIGKDSPISDERITSQKLSIESKCVTSVEIAHPNQASQSV